MAHGRNGKWHWAAAAGNPEPPPIDDRLSTRLDSLRKSFRRDLPDQIEAVFQEACVTGELIVAEDLLRTLEAMQTRVGKADPHVRPRPTIQIAALRETLEHYRRFQQDTRHDQRGGALSDVI